MSLPYYIADCDQRGSGVFAGKTFMTGEFILCFTGPFKCFEEIADFTHFLQVAPDTFMGPSGQADDFVNHSCDPNCAVYLEDDGPVLRALRVILPGEELCFDYGTIMFSEPTEFDCYCGSSRCRKRVGGFNTMPPGLQNHYLANNAVPLLSRYTLEELCNRQACHPAGKSCQSSLPAE
ncbi:MAG TPA: SET domain-containing protein [Gammaproteobacteria bacterium]|nr:SET domain-containing protein [Gammaproteobacteria bacterium]